MNIGLISYPMLFQRIGGLQIQIRETACALKQHGHQVTLIDPVRVLLSAYDIVHVFSAINSNYRIVETARDQGVPVIVSPLLREHWTRSFSRKTKTLDSIVGRVTGWQLKTEFREIASCIENADALVALGKSEANSIINSFNVHADRVHIIPNGIHPRFFSADPAPFLERFDVTPGFVLCVASISHHKNQVAIARALEGTGIQLIVIGRTAKADEKYLHTLLSFRHVRYVGPLDYQDPALPSAYAAAAAFCLPSKSEIMPLSVMESLAAGTPVVMTNRHGMSEGFRSVGLDFVAPDDVIAIRNLLLKYVQSFDQRADCTAFARRYSWATVAKSLIDVYGSVLNN